MLNHHPNEFARLETTCGSLLCELQKIWDEVGESDNERDKMILEIEQECLAVYGRKIDDAKISRAQLLRAIALSEAEVADICSTLGEQPGHCDWTAGGNLRDKLKTITPLLEDMRQRKIDRKNQFLQVLNQLQIISNEICPKDNMYKIIEDEADLSEQRLKELRSQLAYLQEEKSSRLRKVMKHLSNVNSLCMVLGLDFKDTVCKIHPTLNDPKASKDVSNDTIEKMATTIQSLQEVKIQRMQKLQHLATSLVELWNLMDTPLEEQEMFHNITSKIAALEPEITEPNFLSMNNIKYVEGEVSRLEQLKSSKMKELVLKKKLELAEILRKMHTVTETVGDFSIEAIESGSMDFMDLLEQIDLQIAKAKEEASSRKEILEKVEKWFTAREEESWLEEYNRDDNRYNAGRGSHLSLKRAEKARVLVNKIPAMVEALTCKVTAWEKETGTEFSYDGVRLISMLEDYSCMRQEKELERQRQKDHRKLQVQLIAEQEAIYGSKPSPSKSGRKTSTTLTGIASNRKLSLGGVMLQNLKPEKEALCVHSNKKIDGLYRNSPFGRPQSVSLAAGSGRRNSEIPGNVVNKSCSSVAAKARKVESKSARKPLSPVSLAISSKANIANFLEDKKRTHNGTSLKAVPSVAVTPSKQIVACNEGNKAPNTMPSVPKTPSTFTAPMLMAMTPATPCVSLGAKANERTGDKIEYSFEEVRAGFICPSKVQF
ncbi:65-kDa microtubule-associated protein 4 [Citrus sinensis]|uniref:65-kDa microtubule-associated protein 4 n=1 Tax=Citrus sinensis TaxID=2711 RepID=A0ACB8MQT0_CITSI|nr:65-kDa microtubule-associated protein 4 [Citrus x clementina]XP_024045484.1 65-kDa microtubule-associated protein 4 [Citrus x clementina]XP_024045485.1 65-kDa microtubule-associated protein 4 [Citrus x clementina]XP_024045486.1 65-kDa microtubule-associated protein 4 [Citrus x clementina]KAH9788268.1 65-kDa microtubule-associated protein 4 [Citrus sinensis]